MKSDHHTLSVVREKSPFATPPHILVVADDDAALEALELAEALDEYGAEAEVRLGGDASDGDHHQPDAVIFAGPPSGYRLDREHTVLIGLAGGSEPASGYDLVVSRPVNASSLMARLGEYLPHFRM